MIYATSYQRNGKATPRPKANAIVQPVKPICGQDVHYKGCQRNTKRQAQISASNDAAHAFLRTSFAPKLLEPEFIRDNTNTAKMERDFYKSLSQLARHYGIELRVTRSLGFPYNISEALTDVKEQLKAKANKWQEVRLLHAEGCTFFANEKRFDTGSTLYYIPIQPLYLMLRDPQYKHTARLLVSVCTYLYKIADIPYYRQECNYLCYMYDMLRQMYEEEPEEPDPELLNEFKKAVYVGDIMERKFLHFENLTRFKERVNRFRSRGKFDDECYEVAKKAFVLYEEFPKLPIHHRFKATIDNVEDEDSYIVTMEKYVSFFASGRGRFADLLIEFVNNDLQECTIIEEPVIYEPFNGTAVKEDDFEFEKRMFALIDDLTTLLYQYENKQL